VNRQSDKRAVLERMEKYALDWFPVVNESEKVEGIVDRSRLIASMILEITNQLEGIKVYVSRKEARVENGPLRFVMRRNTALRPGRRKPTTWEVGS
jgi:hypothetical protein